MRRSPSIGERSRNFNGDCGNGEQQTGETLRVLLCSDARQDAETGIQRLHYDVIGYSTASVDKARDAIKAVWAGMGVSLTAMRMPEKAIRYALKYTRRNPHEFRCLLAKRNGVNQVYGMATLCRPFGTSKDELWKEHAKNGLARMRWSSRVMRRHWAPQSTGTGQRNCKGRGQ